MSLQPRFEVGAGGESRLKKFLREGFRPELKTPKGAAIRHP